MYLGSQPDLPLTYDIQKDQDWNVQSAQLEAFPYVILEYKDFVNCFFYIY